MNKTEIEKKAIKKLQSKPVKNIKTQLCQKMLVDKKEKKDCIREFDKAFIRAFIKSYNNSYQK